MTKRVNDRDTRANINKIFALYDDERTGYISIKNLRRVAEEIGENVSEQELQELITRADVDCDGLVSEEEFPSHHISHTLYNLKYLYPFALKY